MASSKYRLMDEMQSWGASIEARVRDSGIIDRIFTDRTLLIIGYVTGAAGPLQRMFTWLRAHGIGERVIKSTIAAVVSYWLAMQIPGNPHPTFAPISAVFSINLTIAGGMHGAGQRVLGILAGILLAIFVHNQIENEYLAIGLVVFISFYIGRQLNLEPTGTQQITMTALLIIFIGSRAAVLDTAWLRLVNTVLGTAIGLLANASVAPTNMVPSAREEVTKLGSALSRDMKAIASAYRDGMTHDRAVELLTQARQTAQQLQTSSDAVDLAAESLKYNLQARKLRQTLSHYTFAQEHLTHASFHCRTLARGTADMMAQDAPHDWMAPDALGRLIGDVVDVAAEAVRARADWIDKADFGRTVPLDSATLEAKQAALLVAAAEWRSQLDQGGIFYLGEVVSLSIQLATEMCDPALDDD